MEKKLFFILLVFYPFIIALGQKFSINEVKNIFWKTEEISLDNQNKLTGFIDNNDDQIFYFYFDSTYFVVIYGASHDLQTAQNLAYFNIDKWIFRKTNKSFFKRKKYVLLEKQSIILSPNNTYTCFLMFKILFK